MRRLLLLIPLMMFGCDDGEIPGFNVFTVDDDKQLGRDLAKEIEKDPETYPVLDPDEYAEAYDHLERIRDRILDSGEVEYADEFKWKLHIIDDDETLNAFAAPGGYIYVYTGLIHFLESEDEFAGVLGHEIAHADKRHSSQQLTRAFGVITLLNVVLGKNKGMIPELAAAVAGLGFSRKHEAESDEWSVRYLCETSYAADGAAGFFEKLEGMEIPEFLSTHPSSDSRVEDINGLADDLGCSTELATDGDWEGFLASLPEPATTTTE